MPARSYRQSAGAARWALPCVPSQGDAAVAVHDVTTHPEVFEAVVALRDRSLPGLVGPDWSSAAGAEPTGWSGTSPGPQCGSTVMFTIYKFKEKQS